MFYMWFVLSIIKPALMSMLHSHVYYSSASYLPQGQHTIYMCPDIIFQALLPPSRLITWHYMICHVTAMSRASSSFKISQKQNKRNTKSNKIDKRKEKLLMSKAFHNPIDDPCDLKSQKTMYNMIWISKKSIQLCFTCYINENEAITYLVDSQNQICSQYYDNIQLTSLAFKNPN